MSTKTSEVTTTTTTTAATSQQIMHQILEKATHFFSFNMETLIDDIYNSMDDYVSDGVDVFERNVRQFKGQETKGSFIRAGSDELMGKMRGAFDRNFDKLEIYMLRNIFHVPDDICIEYDGNMRPNKTNEDLKRAFAAKSAAVDGEIVELRKSLREAQMRAASLRADCESARMHRKEDETFAKAIERLNEAVEGEDAPLDALFSKLSVDVEDLEKLKDHMDKQRVAVANRARKCKHKRRLSSVNASADVVSASEIKTPKRGLRARPANVAPGPIALVQKKRVESAPTSTETELKTTTTSVLVRTNPKKKKKKKRRQSTTGVINKILERRTSFIPISPSEMDIDS
eukprot:g1050.t1